jgi:hypothetical protein
VNSNRRSFGIVAAAFTMIVAAAVSVTVLPGSDETFTCGDRRLTESQIARLFGVSVSTLQRSRSTSSVTYESLCEMPESLRKRALRKADHPKPDHPAEAVAWRNMTLRSEDGTIPDGALMRARAELDQFRASPGMVGEGAGINNGSWTSLGPGNIGGRIRSILINPGTPATMLVGSVSGGIWRTTNGGTTWAPVNDFMANLAIGSMAATPNDFNVMYAGTGEGFYNADRIRGAGVFKSTDGGLTWSQLASTTNADFHYVNRLAISPDSSILLAATRPASIAARTPASLSRRC